jgi:hypothetical protein
MWDDDSNFGGDYPYECDDLENWERDRLCEDLALEREDEDFEDDREHDPRECDDQYEPEDQWLDGSYEE